MNFTETISNFATEALSAAEATRKDSCIGVGDRAIDRTAVGNPMLWKDKNAAAQAIREGYVGGQLKGNWQTSINTPNTSKIDRIDASGAFPKEELRSNLGKGDVTVFITNNQDYAEKIEYGYSSQAPQGMVRVTVAEFEGIVNQAASKNSLK